MTEFPKKQIDDLQCELRDFFDAQHTDPEPPKDVRADPKDLEDLITYAELANARIRELENDVSGLLFKVRCVAQALK